MLVCSRCGFLVDAPMGSKRAEDVVLEHWGHPADNVHPLITRRPWRESHCIGVTPPHGYVSFTKAF